MVHGVAKSRTRLSNFTFTFYFPALEKEMATHSSVLAWRIPGMGELGGLPSVGSHKVGHDWSDLAAVATAKSFSIFGYKECNQFDFGIDPLVMSICKAVSYIVAKGCLLWPVHSLGRIHLAFALLHFVLQDQICLLLQVSWLPTFAFQSPVMNRTCFFGVSSRRSSRSSRNWSTDQLLWHW